MPIFTWNHLHVQIYIILYYLDENIIVGNNILTFLHVL